MNEPLQGLDQPCATCERPVGDHTLREWSTCVGTTTTDLPFEAMPDDAVARAAGDAIRRSFGIDDDIIVADHVVAKALVLDGQAPGGLVVRFPAVLHEFQVGRAGAPPVEVAKVLYAGGSADVVRAFGRLIRDTSNGAANAAERAS